MEMRWVPLCCVLKMLSAGLFLLGLAGCTSPFLHQGRIGNLEHALVEVRDQQDRQAAEFRERLESLEMSLLLQERLLQDCTAKYDLSGLHPEDPSRVTPERKTPGPAASPALSEPGEPAQSSLSATPPEKPTPPTQVPAKAPKPEARPAPISRSALPPPVSIPAERVEEEVAKNLYDRALAYYFSGEYAQARTEFFTFQERFPDHPLVPNALYWKAETHYAQKQFAQSILVFKELSRRYPQSAKNPDALLKAGFAYEQLGDYPNARFHLQVVITDHPDTSAADLAQKRLSQLPANSS